jgi:uncharacterized protein YggE
MLKQIRLGFRQSAAVLGLIMLGGMPTAEAQLLPPSINVTGNADRSVQPDIAYLEIVVESRKARLEDARRDAGARTLAVLRGLESLAVPKDAIDSGSLLVQPQFTWDAKAGESRLQGYIVSRTVRIRLLDLDKLGSILERSVEIGANQVMPPRFALQNETRIRRELIAQATRDATQNARAVAEGLGVTLGIARKVDTVDSDTTVVAAPMMLRTNATAEGAAVEESYRPGQVTLRARVSASFDFAP